MMDYREQFGFLLTIVWRTAICPIPTRGDSNKYQCLNVIKSFSIKQLQEEAPFYCKLNSSDSDNCYFLNKVLIRKVFKGYASSEEALSY